MKKWQDMLFSPRGMGVINGLFLLAVLVPGGWLMAAACLLWLGYLYCGFRRTRSVGLRTAFALLAVCAAGLLALNLYGLLRAL